MGEKRYPGQVQVTGWKASAKTMIQATPWRGLEAAPSRPARNGIVSTSRLEGRQECAEIEPRGMWKRAMQASDRSNKNHGAPARGSRRPGEKRQEKHAQKPAHADP